MRKTVSVTLVILFILAIALFSPSFRVQGQANSSAVVSFQMSQASFNVGDTFNASVTIDNAPAIFAAQVEFTYDPTVLNVTNVAEGTFLRSAGPTIVPVLGATENLLSAPPTGEVDYAASTSGPTASGSGVLLIVTFRVVGLGASKLHLLSYAAGSGGPGTYFLDAQFSEVIPSLVDVSYGTPVSLKVDQNYVNEGQTVTFSGIVSGSGSSSVSNIILQYQLEGGNWTVLIGNLGTNETGYFTYRWATNMTGNFLFQVYYTASGKNVYSPVTNLTVGNLVSHIGYLYDAIVALIIVIVALAILDYVRIRRRPKDVPTGI